MANEVTVRAVLTIRKGNLVFASNPQQYSADASTAKGPVPGNVLATTSGVNVDLSGLTTPGFAFLHNLDSTNYVEYGIHDGSTFFPLGELLPNEFTIVRLARNILAGSNELRLKANTASCNVSVSAFEK